MKQKLLLLMQDSEIYEVLELIDNKEIVVFYGSFEECNEYLNKMRKIKRSNYITRLKT